jgi:transcription elongation factor Elf1
MGVTTFPCPRCGQAQRETHDNGETVEVRLCAACEEKQKSQTSDRNTENAGSKKASR